MRGIRGSTWSLAATTAAVGLVVLGGAAAYAQTEERLEGKVRAGNQIVVSADETVPGDLYAAGGTVRVEGRVEGDVVAAGGQVSVTGTVTGDALLAGGTVTVGGDVEGDVRIGAGQSSVTGAIGEDLLIAGGQTTVGSDAVIGEDLVFSAGRMAMDGRIEGNLVGTAGVYQETGSVGGTREVAEAPEAAPPTFGQRLLAAVGRYVSLLLVGALLLWLAPGIVRGAVEILRREPLLSLGVGALGLLGALVAGVLTVLIAVLVAVLLAFLQMGGLAAFTAGGGVLLVALLAYAVGVIVEFVAQVVVVLWLGRYVIAGDGGWSRAFGALAVGLVALVILEAVPIIGGIVQLLVVLLGFGALLLMAFRRRRRRRDVPSRVSPGSEDLPYGEAERDQG